MPTPTIISRAVQDFETWLKEIHAAAGLADEQRAYDALRGVLHLLRDRMTPDEATDLGAQLPTLVRGVYYEGFAPRKTPGKQRSEAQFLEALAERVDPAEEMDLGAATLAVFACLEKHLDPGEIDHVVQMMPADVKTFWSEEARLRAEERQAR